MGIHRIRLHHSENDEMAFFVFFGNVKIVILARNMILYSYQSHSRIQPFDISNATMINRKSICCCCCRFIDNSECFACCWLFDGIWLIRRRTKYTQNDSSFLFIRHDIVIALCIYNCNHKQTYRWNIFHVVRFFAVTFEPKIVVFLCKQSAICLLIRATNDWLQTNIQFISLRFSLNQILSTYFVYFSCIQYFFF